jgi:hypothetical protein
VAVNESAVVYFDGGSKFTGSDDQKVAQVIAWLKSLPTTAPRQELQLPARVVNWPTPIPTITGMRVVGSRTPAREFGTGCVLNYTGPSGSSLFQLFTNSGYGYPSGGVSRDVGFDGVQFNAGNDRDFLPPAPGGFDSNYVQWCWTFNNCGWQGWRKLANAWGDDLAITGLTHLQAGVDTLRLGGSENYFFSSGSVADSAQAAWTSGGKPFLDYQSSKSIIGSIMLSARGNSYQLLVSYGHDGKCIGTHFDAPDSAPTQGFQVRITGGDGFSFTACNFKGGDGIQVSGGTQVLVEGCAFGPNRGLLRVESTFTGVVLWGLNMYTQGTPREVAVAKLSQIICLDPRVTIKDLTGTVLRAATA